MPSVSDDSLATIRRLRWHIRQRRRYVLLLGAGASIESGGRTAPDIAYALAGQLYQTSDKGERQKRFQQEYKSALTFENVLDALASGSAELHHVLAPFFSDMEPSRGYNCLAALLKAGHFHNVVFTTNYDHMLEDAIAEDTSVPKDVTVEVLIGDRIVPDIPAFDDDTIYIVKLHGDIAPAHAPTIRATKRDTMWLPASSRLLVSTLCTSFGLVVVGYRLKDFGVLSALQNAEPTTAAIYFVAKDRPDRHRDETLYLVLDHHQSASNIASGTTFDAFFESLWSEVADAYRRHRHRTELNSAWHNLDRARSFGDQRQSLLAELRELVLRLSRDEPPLEEVRALKEFVEYEISKSGETYRLLQGVEYLEKALRSYNGLMDVAERLAIEYALLGELLNVFLSGNQIPGGRLVHINRLTERGETMLNSVPASNVFLRDKFNVALGEAFKEKAMITEGLDEHVSSYRKAREHCQAAIDSLKDLDGDEAKQLLGAAYRHIAVTFELEGDHSHSQEERRKLYEVWKSYSEMAADVLTPIGEDAVRAYALMNLAASYNRLAKFESRRDKKRKMLDHGLVTVESALECLGKVVDDRGRGWVYIHRCENLRERLEHAALDRGEKEELLLKLEEAANRSVAWLRRVDDHFAQGLAYMELGVALLSVYQAAEDRPRAKLVRAKAALREAIKQLAATGYYRGEGEAYWWLAQSAFLVAEDATEKEDLVEAIDAISAGLVTTVKKLESLDELREIFAIMERRLKEIL